MDAIDKKSIKAGVWYTLSSFISKAILYLCTPLYTRILTLSEFGYYNNYTSWQSILFALVTLDLSSSISIAFVDYSKENSFNEYISTISITSCLFPFFISCIIWANKTYFMHLFQLDSSSICIMSIYLCFSSIIGIFQTEQRSKLKYKESSLITMLSSVGTVLLSIFLIIFMENNLIAIMVGNTFFYVLVNIFLLIFILKRKLVFKFKYLKYALYISLPLIPHALASTILGSSDKVMITNLCGSQYTAIYSLVYTISLVIMMFVQSINRAWIPWFFNKLVINDVKTIQQVVNYIINLIVLFSFGFCLLAPEVIYFVGGRKYQDAIFLVPPLILYCISNYIYTLYANIEFFKKKTFCVSFATILASLINIILNYLCIKHFGYKAAAYTTLISGVAMILFHFLMVIKLKMSYIFNNKMIFKKFIISLLLMVLSFSLYSNNFLRYIFIIVYLMLVIWMLIKNRIIIKNAIKSIIS